MELLSNRFFSINIRVMSFLCFYYPGKKHFLKQLRSCCLLIIFTLSIPVFGSLFFVFNSNLTEEQINNDAFLVAQMVCQFGKLLFCALNMTKIKECIVYFDSLEIHFLKQRQLQIINNFVKICRRNTIIFLGCIISGNIFWVSRPFMMGSEVTLPVDIWLPIDTNSPRVFPFVYVFLAMCVAFTSMSCSAIDPLIAGLACAASGQLEMLKDNLTHLQEYAILQTHIDSHKAINNLIKTCLKHHSEILLYVKKYQDSFQAAMMSQILGSSIVVCFSCWQLSKAEPFSFNFISMISFLITFLAQDYMFCYYCTILYEKSNTLTNAIYMGNWYEYKIESRKYLIILMECTKRPLIVISGKVIDVSVNTFTTILKRSYSLLAVLNNM